MIPVTTFTGLYDVTPNLVMFDDWSGFADFLEAESAKPAVPDRWTKDHTICACPAVYETGSTRKKANVHFWNWWAVDIDNKGSNKPGSSMLDIVEKMEAVNCPFVIYTTTSHQAGADCYRVMFPISRPVEIDEFAGVWASIALFFGCVDANTKDESRLFIAPRTWSEHSLFLRFDAGEPLDIDTVRFNHPVSVPMRTTRAHSAKFRADLAGYKPVEPGQASLDGDFVKPEALAKATQGEQGGRLFGLMLSAAGRALAKGYAISEGDLANIGYEFAARVGRHTSDIEHDAAGALERALSSHAENKATRFDRAFKPTARWMNVNRSTEAILGKRA